MADVVSSEVRSRMMSGIRGKNTKPEILIRRGLHAAGFRYSLHRYNLPGKPDLVLPKYNAVIFVNGCFWHMHNCYLFKMPSSRKEFWIPKLERNVKTDERKIELLNASGWRIAIIWECALKGKTKLDSVSVIAKITKWLLSKKSYLEVKGT